MLCSLRFKYYLTEITPHKTEISFQQISKENHKKSGVAMPEALLMHPNAPGGHRATPARDQFISQVLYCKIFVMNN